MSRSGGEALRAIDTWPVEHAAGAVVTADGTETVGDVDRVFPLASVTKPLVALAALVAVEEGAVDLSTPAGPEGATVRHLLAHAAGYAFDGREVVSEPGRRRIYSSAGFEVLAETIEQHTEIPFAEYVAEAVFAPLGMTSSTLDGSAGHGASSTVSDLSRFVGELLEPTLISAELFTEATTVVFPGLDGILPGYGRKKPNDWGLGFELRDHKSPHWTGTTNSPATFGHFGQSGTFLWVDPQLRAGTVALTDRPFGDWAKPLWTELGDAVVENLSGVSQRDAPMTS